MEEKERYMITYEDDGLAYLFDKKNLKYIISDGSINDEEGVSLCNLLNQQDKRIKELEQENLSLQEQSIRDNQNWIEETTQLKQQLHDLPKKIVGEIKKELYDCGKTYLEDEPYIEICIVQGILDRILKKYGGENDN